MILWKILGYTLSGVGLLLKYCRYILGKANFVHLQPVKIGVSFKQEAFSIREGVDRDEVGEGDDSQDGVECSQCGVVGHGTP